MKTHAQEVISHVKSITCRPIKSFLCQHLNLEAQSLSDLFGQWGEGTLLFFPQHYAIVVYLLKMAPRLFQSALIKQLTQLPVSEVMALILPVYELKGRRASGFYALNESLFQESKHLLAHWFSTLEPNEIFQFFTNDSKDYARTTSFSTHAIMALRLNEGDALQSYLKALSKLSPEQRYALLQHGSLMDLLSLKRTNLPCVDELAKFLISWLTPLELEQKKTLFLGDSAFVSERFSILSHGGALNLLHVAFSFSSTVLDEVLRHLSHFPTWFVTSLLLKAPRNQDNYDLTPFALLMDQYGVDEDATKKCHRLIAFLLRDKAFNLVFTCDPQRHYLSPLKKMIKKKQHDFFEFFLDQLFSLEQYSSVLKELHAYVLREGDDRLQLLFDARMVFEHARCLQLSSLLQTPHLNFKQIGTVQLMGGKTILHYLLEKGSQFDGVVLQLIEQGMPFLIEDDEGQSVLALALMNHHVTLLNWVAHHAPLSYLQTLLLTRLLLASGEYEVIDQWLSHGQVFSQQDWAALLTSLPAQRVSVTLRESWLMHAQGAECAWLTLAHESQDSVLRLLIAAGEQIKPPIQQPLMHALKQLILRELSAQNDSFERIGLISFLFHFGLRVFGAVSNALQLSVDYQDRLKQQVYQAVLRPSFLRTLPHQDEAWLGEYFGKQSGYFQGYLEYYFAYGHLLCLPDALLLSMANTIGPTKLSQLWMLTHHPVVYAILLSRVAHQDPQSIENAFPAWVEGLLQCPAPVFERAIALATRDDLWERLLHLVERAGTIAHLKERLTQLYHTAVLGQDSSMSVLREGLTWLTTQAEQDLNPIALETWIQHAQVGELKRVFSSWIQRLSTACAAGHSLAWLDHLDQPVLAGVLAHPDVRTVLGYWMHWATYYALHSTSFALFNMSQPMHFPSLSKETGQLMVQMNFESFVGQEQYERLLWMSLLCAEWHSMIEEEQGDVFQTTAQARLGGMMVRLAQEETISQKIITSLIGGYFAFLDGTAEDQEQFLIAFHVVLRKLEDWQTHALMNTMLNQAQQQQLLSAILSNLQAASLPLYHAAQGLFKILVQHGFQGSTWFEQLKYQLGAQDLSLLTTPLFAQALDAVLMPTASTDEAVYHGVWIQRLLTLPRFIAQSHASVVSQLIARYQALSLVLKQEEYAIIKRALKQSRFNSQHATQLCQLQTQSYWAVRAKRLLTFRSDDAIRAMLLDLEEACATEPDRTLGHQALNVLTDYYRERLETMRSDYLFRFSDALYQRIFRTRGDLRVAKSRLLSWLKTRLPHHYFSQDAFLMHKKCHLMNQAGEEVGVLDSFQYTMSVDAVELTQTMPAGSLFYNRLGQVIGHLTEEGLFQSELLFQKATAAHLLRVTPLEELRAHPDALALLLTHFFHEAAWEPLYATPALDAERRQYLEESFIHYLVTNRKQIMTPMLMPLLNHVQPIRVKQLFMHPKLNFDLMAHALEASLAHPTIRPCLWTEWAEPIDAALERLDSEDHYLEDYLVRYKGEDWFLSGLQLLLHRSGLKRLTLVLDRLHRMIGHQTLTLTDFHAILQAILSTEAGATLWCGWARKERSKIIKKYFLSFCVKPVVMSLLAHQHQQPFEARRSLLLEIMGTEHARLFDPHDLRLSAAFSWQDLDLKALITFVHDPHVKQTQARKYIEAALVFRCANFGMTDLFYHAHHHVDDFFVDEIIPKKMLFMQEAPLPADLQERQHAALRQEDERTHINWNDVAASTWQVLGKQSGLSLWHAFLWNYDGPGERLFDLVRSVMVSQVLSGRDLTPFCQLMANFPDRSVSRVIYHALVHVLVQNPYTLNQTALKCILKSGLHGEQDALAWLVSLGRAKHYQLVAHCCRLLLQGHGVTNKRWVQCLQKEAELEFRLEKHVGRWYFSWYAFFKRLWHYGMHGLRHRTRGVAFAEEPCQAMPHAYPATIQGPWVAGSMVTAALATHRKQKRLIELRAKVEQIGGHTKREIKFFHQKTNDRGEARFHAGYTSIRPTGS